MEAVAVAVAVGVAEAVGVADGEALADAEGLAIMLPFFICPLSEALGVALAAAEGLAIMLSSIICPLGIMCSPFICRAIAPGASTRVATRASAAMYISRFIDFSVSFFWTP